MHRALAGWLIAKWWHAPIAVAIFGLLSPPGLLPPGVWPFSVMASAIPVLLLLSGDLRLAVQASIVGCATLGAILIAGGQTLYASVAFVALLYLAPAALAVSVQRSGSLRWSFQIAVVGAMALVGALHVGLDNPTGSWEQFVGDWVHLIAVKLGPVGYKMDETAIKEMFAATNWGTFVGNWLTTVLSSLFLGCWWHSLLHAPGAFGREFQQLRLGKAFGSLALMIVIAAFAFDKLATREPILDALLWVAIISLAIQGLAAAHRLKASGRVGRGLLTATYVLLVMPVMNVFVLMLLAGWGVVDNWRRVA